MQGTELTNRGLDLVAKLMAGKRVTFTKAVIGDGAFQDEYDIHTATKLKNPKTEFPIQDIKFLGNGEISLEVHLNNSLNEEGFFIREIGIYAEDPDIGEILFGVVARGDRTQWFDDNTVHEQNIILDLIFKVGNVDEMQVVVNNSIMYVTKQEFWDLAGRGRTNQTVKENWDMIKDLQMDMAVMKVHGTGGATGEDVVVIDMKELEQTEKFWGIWDRETGRLVI